MVSCQISFCILDIQNRLGINLYRKSMTNKHCVIMWDMKIMHYFTEWNNHWNKCNSWRNTASEDLCTSYLRVVCADKWRSSTFCCILQQHTYIRGNIQCDYSMSTGRSPLRHSWTRKTDVKPNINKTHVTDDWNSWILYAVFQFDICGQGGFKLVTNFGSWPWMGTLEKQYQLSYR